MDSESLYKYLGLGVVIFVVLYFVLKSLTFQANIIETMANGASSESDLSASLADKDKVPAAIKSNTNNVEDSLLITKYRKFYEDSIIDLDSNISTNILSLVLNNAELISRDPGSDDAQKIITKINSMKQFRDGLNDAMKTLDKKRG
jgi:hypothetical protein